MDRKKYISNGVISLEEQRETDYPLLFDSWNEPDTVAGYNYKLPYSLQEYGEQCKKADTWSAVILRSGDRAVIGRVGISPGLPDLTVTVLKPYRNQGYGVTAFSLAASYCFEVLNYEEIYAGCYEDNIPSLKMIEKCGFVPHPEGNVTEKHIVTGADRVQYDFILRNPGHRK